MSKGIRITKTTGDGLIDVEVRCVGCTCSKAGDKGKLLGTLENAPLCLVGSGLKLTLPCQNKKSNLRNIIF
jgi:hypothetical protein